MSSQHLATYLNDHLAGSTAAIELLAHLEGAHPGTPLARFLADLRADIIADREELKALMGRLQVVESGPRKAAAWVTEKFGQLKLWLDDPAGGSLRVFEALEALSLGIEGKRLLWRALAAAGEEMPRIRGTDYERLELRAVEQRNRVEVERLKTAKSALGGEAPKPQTIRT